MKRLTYILALCLGLLDSSYGVQAAGASSVPTVFIYKLDGTRHCMPDTGTSVAEMAAEMSAAGIDIISSSKGYDGREGIALCGEPTGQINIYEIPESDLATASGMGFKQLPANQVK